MKDAIIMIGFLLVFGAISGMAGGWVISLTLWKAYNDFKKNYADKMIKEIIEDYNKFRK